MFAVQPYSALRLVKYVGKPETWAPCRVVGIDAGSDDASRYVIEVRNADGTFYLDRVDLIRKPAPTA